jgi:hypothetical protein
MRDRVCKPVLVRGCDARVVVLLKLPLLAGLCLTCLHTAMCQGTEAALANPPVANAAEMPNAPTVIGAGGLGAPAPRRPVEQEISVMGMIPDGDYRLISTTIRCDAWTLSVEYDRRWGKLLRAQMDYAAEVIPFALLSEPAKSDFWGNPASPYQQHLYGVAILPVGFRMLWRADRPLKFYLSSKAGVIAFNQKALSLNASYANGNVQAAFGVQYRLSDRVDLRVEPFTFFHVSNAYLAASNPGMDELASRYGISYHLRGRGGR